MSPAETAKPQTVLEFGPIHPWLPASMVLTLELYGDRISGSSMRLGYLSKNIEQKVIGKDVQTAQLLFSRIEPESAMVLDRLFSEVVEKSLGWKVDARGMWIRDLSTSISELTSALKYLSDMAHVLGLSIVRHIVLKHREELLDLVELLSGSRYGYHYIVPGGARYDITEGFIERLEHWTKKFTDDFARIEAMFLWTHEFQNRLKSMGRAIDEGDFGFVSEASVETTRYGVVSHVESRLKYALQESLLFATELHALCQETFPGQHKNVGGYEVKEKRSEVEITTYRGSWKLALGLSPDLSVQSIHLESPSEKIIKAVAPSLENEQIDDLPVILQSLNFLVTELDR